MSGLVNEAHSLRNEISAMKGEKERLAAANKVVLKLDTEASDLKVTAGSLVISLQKGKARVVEDERDLKKSREVVATSDVHEKALSVKVFSLTTELSSVRV